MRLFKLLTWPHRLLLTAVVLVALLALAYGAFCHQIGRLSDIDDSTTVVMCGVVSAVHEMHLDSPVDIYQVEDPTGSVYVITRAGAPRVGTAAIVWGRKETSDRDRPLVQEKHRVGTF